MHRGYCKIARRIHDDHIWQEKPFDRARAWLDLILLARYVDGHIMIRGNKVLVKRGQVGWSELGLADKWGWSRGKVNRFLCELQTDHRIIQQKSRLTTLITIVNYDKFQAGDTTDSTTDSTTDGQQTDTKNKVKKEKNKTYISDDFENFWLVCPLRAKRCGKSAAEKSWRNHVNGNASEVIKSMQVHSMCKDWTKDNGQFIPMASTWINQHRWTAEIEQENPSWKII